MAKKQPININYILHKRNLFEGVVNREKIGTIVLFAFAGLFSVIYFAAGREIAFLYTNDAEVIALCGFYATKIGVAILIASIIAYVLYLATKNLPWFVPLIITAVTGIVVYAVSSLFVRIANPSLTAASCGIMVPIAALIPALRIVNAEIPKEECEAKQEANGQKAVAAAKSKVVSALLAFFLGTTGVHRYYLGYKKQGIIQTCGFASLIIGYVMYIPAMMDGSAGVLLFSINNKDSFGSFFEPSGSPNENIP